MSTAGTAAPGLLVPGLAVPGSGGPPSSPGPGLVGEWTAFRGITDGTVSPPAPMTMPLECPVDNTGSLGNGLVAYVSWTLPAGYLGCDMAVTDDAHNVWRPVGNPAASSASAGFTRCAIWTCPSAFAAGNVYVSQCGFPGPVYPAVIGVTVAEFSGMSPYLGTPVLVTGSANSAGSVAANLPAPGATALMLTVAAADGTHVPSQGAGGWTALTGVTGSGGGGAYLLKTAPAWQVSSSPQSSSWTVTGTPDLSAASAAILLSNPAPSQPDPNWPAFALEAGFGSGALTPPGQVAWTDLTSRWLAGEQATTVPSGKQYELDTLQAAEITVVIDDNDGSLTPDNSQSPYFPDVVADLPLRLTAWWQQRAYGVFSGFAERFPVSWDSEWYGITEAGITDAWSLQQNQLGAVLREEMTADPNLQSLWTCGDPEFSSGTVQTLSAVNIAPGNSNVLQVVESKNGVVPGAAAQQFGAAGGALPGDQSGSLWQQQGLTSGSEGYGWCLYAADPDYPLLDPGITVMGWFTGNISPQVPAVTPTQIENSQFGGSVGALILLRASNAAAGPMFQVFLESPVGSDPGAICVAVWDQSTGAATVTTVFSGNWLQAGIFHVAMEVTQSTWTLFVNGVSAGTGSCNLPEVMSWLSFMGCADRYYTGSMLNGQCGYLGVYGVLVPADRIQSVYTAGTPNPALVAGGATATRNAAQFGGEFSHFRIERLLAYGGWAGPRSISQSGTTQMAPVTDIQGSTAVIAASGQVSVSSGGEPAGQAAGNIVFSDGGFIFVDSCGVICYLSRNDLFLLSPAWSLGEDTQAGMVPYQPDAKLGYDKSLLYNAAELTQSTSLSGTPFVATNPASIAQHSQYVYNATAYQYLPAQVGDLANWIVTTRGTVRLRAGQVTVDARANPGNWPLLLGIQPAQAFTLTRSPQLAAYTVTMTPLTCSLTRSLDYQQGAATVEIGSDSWPEGTVMIIGDPVRGLADGNNILGW